MAMKDLAKPANDPVSIGIRRYQNRLRVTGAGVMVFGLWSIIKIFIIALLSSDNTIRLAFSEIRNQGLSSAGTVAAYILFAVVMLLMFSAALSVRFIVYVSARKESLGILKHKNLYLILSVLMVIVGILSLVNIPARVKNGDYTVSDAIVSAVVEVTSIATLLELLHSALKIRKLRKAAK